VGRTCITAFLRGIKRPHPLHAVEVEYGGAVRRQDEVVVFIERPADSEWHGAAIVFGHDDLVGLVRRPFAGGIAVKRYRAGQIKIVSVLILLEGKSRHSVLLCAADAAVVNLEGKVGLNGEIKLAATAASRGGADTVGVIDIENDDVVNHPQPHAIAAAHAGF